MGEDRGYVREYPSNAGVGVQGRPPYRSSDLLKLYLYGYKNKLRSSRQLEHACKVNLEVIWLLKGLRPSARKVAYFRKDNTKAFKLAFRYFVVLLKDWELIEGETNLKFTYGDFRWFLNYALIDTRLRYLPGNPQKPLTARHSAGSVLVYESEKWRFGHELTTWANNVYPMIPLHGILSLWDFWECGISIGAAFISILKILPIEGKVGFPL